MQQQDNFSCPFIFDSKSCAFFVFVVQGKWPFETGQKSANCWCEPPFDYFRVRGANYLRDRKKVSAEKPFADLVAVGRCTMNSVDPKLESNWFQTLT
jgi:hypothetical protein